MPLAIDPGVAVAGLLVGLLVGTTGVGGGALMAPILILIVGVRPLTVVGTDLVYAAVAKLFGAWQHHRLGHVDLRVVGAMAAGSVPGSLLGAALLVRARDTLGADVDRVVLHVLGFVLILVALSLVLRPARPAPAAAPAIPPGAWPVVMLALGGSVVGLLVGMTSVGSGSLIVAFLAVATALPIRRLIGTDVFHGALLSGAAAIAHGLAGTVDLAITASLLCGAIPGVLVGSRMTAALPDRAVRSALAAVLLISGVTLI
jgi:uncharacterized membrane protein YfcA